MDISHNFSLNNGRLDLIRANLIMVKTHLIHDVRFKKINYTIRCLYGCWQYESLFLSSKIFFIQGRKRLCTICMNICLCYKVAVLFRTIIHKSMYGDKMARRSHTVQRRLPGPAETGALPDNGKQI